MAVFSVLLMVLGAGFIAGANSCLMNAAWAEMSAPLYAIVSLMAWSAKLLGFAMLGSGGFFFISSLLRGRAHGNVI